MGVGYESPTLTLSNLTPTLSAAGFRPTGLAVVLFVPVVVKRKNAPAERPGRRRSAVTRGPQSASQLASVSEAASAVFFGSSSFFIAAVIRPVYFTMLASESGVAVASIFVT